MSFIENTEAAEQQLIGVVLLDPKVLNQVSLVVTVDDFQTEHGRRAYGIAIDMHESGQCPDQVSIVRHSGRPAGFMAWLAGCVGQGITSSAGQYATDVRRYSIVRSLGRICASMGARLQDNECDPVELCQWITGRVEQVLHRGDDLNMRTLDECSNEAMSEIADCMNSDRQIGIPTGFTDLDGTIGGLFAGELTTIAARPGVGKTSLAIQICRHIASLGKRAVVFSLEMTGGELARRSICSVAEVSLQRVRSGVVSPDDFVQMQDAAETVSELDMHVDDTSAIDVHRIAAMCRVLAAEKPIGCIAVDYIGLVSPTATYRNRPRHEQIGEVTRALKRLSKDLKCPVLALSQVNREAAKDGKLQLHHLKSSGSIEEDSNSVWFINSDGHGDVTIDVAKNRNGQTGTIALAWDPELTRFRDSEARDQPNYEAVFDSYSKSDY